MHFQAQAAKPGFGGVFSVPQAATTGFGSTTSGFGAPQAATTGFGAPLTGFAAPQQAATGFGVSSGFGTTLATTGSAFGALPASSTPNIFSAAQPSASFSMNNGSSASSFNAVTAAQIPQITLNTRFTELPANYRHVIEQTNSDYKKPMREGLDEIARFQPKVLDELRIELGRTNLAALRLGNQQELLLSEIKSFHDKAKDNLRDVRKYGASGLQQIQNRGGLGSRSYLMSEELPTDFYVGAADKIETRLCNLIEEVQHISRQLTSTLSALSGEEGQYGQQTRIGPQQLVRLIQRQSEAFARVASCVAEIHRQADDVRASYLRTYCKDDGQRYPGSHHGSDPFAAADRAEAANERIMSKKLKAEEFNRANTRPADTAAAVPLQGGVTAATAPSSLTGPSQFSFSVASAPGASAVFGGSNPFGGFTAPAQAAAPAFGFGIAPAAGFGAPAAAPTGFGSTFGAPAAGGFGGGSGFKALDLATAGSGVGFGAAAPATSAFGASFGGGTTTQRKSGNKSRK